MSPNMRTIATRAHDAGDQDAAGESLSIIRIVQVPEGFEVGEKNAGVDGSEAKGSSLSSRISS